MFNRFYGRLSETNHVPTVAEQRFLVDTGLLPNPTGLDNAVRSHRRERLVRREVSLWAAGKPSENAAAREEALRRGWMADRPYQHDLDYVDEDDPPTW